MAVSPWGACPRCGFRVRLARFRKEWTGLSVCPDCWDPRPADTRPPCVGPEGKPVQNAQPEPEPVFREDVGATPL